MGAAQSTNALTASLSAITSVTTNIIDQTTVSNQQGQGVIISGNTGGVKVGDITQEQTLTLNVSALLTATSSSSAQQDMTTTLSQAATSVVSGLNFGQYSDAQNNVNLFLKESIDIATNISNLCQTDLGQTQTIVITNNSGGTAVGNIVQKQMNNMFVNCVESAVAQSDAIQKMQTTLDQSATAKSEGLNIWGIVALAAIIVFGIMAPVAAFSSSIVKYFYVILIIAGIGLIIAYFVWQPTILVVTPYSVGFGNSSGCLPSGAQPPVTTFATPIDAANACQSSDSFVAFDWVGFQPTGNDGEIGTPITPPQTTFYTGIDTSCQVQTDQKMQLFRAPSFTSGNSPPSNAGNPGQGGDYYLETPSTSAGLQGWIFTTGSGWGEDTLWPVPSGYTVSSVAFGQGTPKTPPAANEIYIDISNPKTCYVYVNGNATSVATVTGPGYAVANPQWTNTSGYKTKGTKPWLLYVGAISLGMGLISMVISLAYGGQQNQQGTKMPMKN